MPTIKEPISGLDESSPLLVTPRELLGQTRNSSWVPFSLLLVLTSQVLQHFSRNKPALNPPSPPYPAQPLLSFLQPIHYAFEYLFDFLTRFITTRLSGLLRSTHYLVLHLEILETALAEALTETNLLTTSDHFLFDGLCRRRRPLNALMWLISYWSHCACQMKFLDFLQKSEGWNKDQNTDHGAGQNTAFQLK